jgi:hypothetical protein
VIYPSELLFFFSSCFFLSKLHHPRWAGRLSGHDYPVGYTLSLFFLGHFKDIIMWNVGVKILEYIGSRGTAIE